MFSLLYVLYKESAGWRCASHPQKKVATKHKQSCNPITKTAAERCHCRRTARGAAQTEELGGREAAA
jgi:hypothetical protein